MKPNCVILDDHQRGGLDALRSALGAEVADLSALRDHIPDTDELARKLAGADVLVAIRERTTFHRELLNKLPDLRLLVTLGMRNAAIDLDAARERGIVVAGTRGSSQPTVEMAWALILGLCRHVAEEHAIIREGGPWQTTIGNDLGGRTLALIGLGKVGSGVARVGRAFGMRVRAYTPRLDDERAAELGVERAEDLDDLLESADVVSLHLPLDDRTHGLIDAEALGRMKRDALLVNTSRGPIVDETALLDALRIGRIGGAALDVYDMEPLPADHPYRSAPRLLATPHLGYVTRGNYAAHFSDVAEAIRAYAEGRDVPRQLDGS